jgi:hypothetical protein
MMHGGSCIFPSLCAIPLPVDGIIFTMFFILLAAGGQVRNCQLAQRHSWHC